LNAGHLRYEREPAAQGGDVVTLHLAQEGRPVVVLDWDLLRAIDNALDAIARDVPTLAGFVLASESRVFVAGANLKEIVDLSEKELHQYLEFGAHVFGRIATLPCTTVAAINGAALGGGLEIAMHCDHLLGVEPGERQYPVGLPEAGLSICPGWGGTNLLPARMDSARAIELTATGQTMKARDAADVGLIERLVPADDLLGAAAELARTPKATPRSEPIAISNTKTSEARAALDASRPRIPDTQAARAVLACVEAGLTRGWKAALPGERDNLVRLRTTDEGRGAIEAFFAKTASR
jgi:enoyl-CoA hydratase/carnithine racemase